MLKLLCILLFSAYFQISECFLSLRGQKNSMKQVFAAKCPKPSKNSRQPIQSFLLLGVNDDSINTFQEQNRKSLISIMISMSYLSIIVTMMTLPPCIAYMSSDISFTKTAQLPSILGWATLSTMFGKFILGPITDSLGGNLVMKSAMGLNVFLLILGSKTFDAVSFGWVWIGLSFIYASTWGACSKLVRDIFPQDEWSSLLGTIAAASRFGSIMSSFVFGSILSVTNSWRKTFLFSAIIQSGIFLFYMIADAFANIEELSRDSVMKSQLQAVQTKETIAQVLARVSADFQFWLMFIGKIALMTVGQFISFIPLYLTTGLKMEPSRAAISTACFSTGSLISNILGAKYYQRLSPKKQVYTVALANALATFASTGLLLQAAFGVKLMVSQVLALLSLWGATWAAAFYVPPGLVALELGGPRHAALITNIFDAGGFFSAAILSYYAMKLGKLGQWAELMGGLVGCSAVAIVTMFGAMRISMTRKEIAKNSI